jgi:hypothetical protein
LTFDLAHGADTIERQRLANSSWTVAIGQCSAQPPVRLHLLHQIFLI